MKIIKIAQTLFFAQLAICQETVISTNFAVRDFFISENSISYIEKRNLFTKTSTSLDDYFIGGYGLKVFDNSENEEIITVSNELLRPVCSVRFYNRPTDSVQEVFYYVKARALDALLIKETKSVILSMENNKILVVNYAKKPEFGITHEIELNAKSRHLYVKKNTLFYCTDYGDIFRYNLLTNEKKLIISTNKMINSFTIGEKFVIYSTTDGEIVKTDYNNNIFKKVNLANNFALNGILFQGTKLILGTFRGPVLVIDVNEMRVEKVLNFHDRSVLKIVHHGNYLYSTSLDRTIKKWKLN